MAPRQSKKTSKTTKTVTRKQTGDQLPEPFQRGLFKENPAQLTAVKSDLDEIQPQMDKVMLAQGLVRTDREGKAARREFQAVRFKVSIIPKIPCFMEC